jgi:hypothetical protein
MSVAACRKRGRKNSIFLNTIIFNMGYLIQLISRINIISILMCICILYWQESRGLEENYRIIF